VLLFGELIGLEGLVKMLFRLLLLLDDEDVTVEEEDLFNMLLDLVLCIPCCCKRAEF